MHIDMDSLADVRVINVARWAGPNAMSPFHCPSLFLNQTPVFSDLNYLYPASSIKILHRMPSWCRLRRDLISNLVYSPLGRGGEGLNLPVPAH